MSEIFADVPNEGDKLEIDAAFDRLSAKGEKPSESRTEKTIAEGKPSQGGDSIPDDKTPESKGKESAKWRELRQSYSKLQKDFEEYKASNSKPKEVVMPDWWKNQYGNTPESKARFEKVVQDGGELQWLKQQLKDELKAETTAEANVSKAGEEYVETQLSEMAAEGLKFERNSLLKFMVDFQAEYGSGSLLDTEGNYDFRKALNLMAKMQPQDDQSNQLKKQVASQAGRSKVNAGSSKGVPVVSTRALRKGNWRDANSGQFISR